MSREELGPAEKGSRKWLQVLVNECPALIDERIHQAIDLPLAEHINWMSPLKADGYAEYRDEDFISQLDIPLDRESLDSFWPRRGPQWDGLAKSDEGRVFLVEAKSHLDELNTNPCGARGFNLTRIQRSLAQTKWYLRSNTLADWSVCFYQYANRLAHLYFLRELNDLDAYLLCVYFLNDTEMNGPSSEAEWKAAVELLERFLGVWGHKLSRYVLHVFVDIETLNHARTKSADTGWD